MFGYRADYQFPGLQDINLDWATPTDLYSYSYISGMVGGIMAFLSLSFVV